VSGSISEVWARDLLRIGAWPVTAEKLHGLDLHMRLCDPAPTHNPLRAREAAPDSGGTELGLAYSSREAGLWAAYRQIRRRAFWPVWIALETEGASADSYLLAVLTCGWLNT
jgi:hypothetical protein